jgi:hypothetical protein
VGEWQGSRRDCEMGDFVLVILEIPTCHIEAPKTSNSEKLSQLDWPDIQGEEIVRAEIGLIFKEKKL